MSRRRKQSKTSSRPTGSSTSSTPRGRKYTPGELFMAALGLVILVIAAGVVITAILD
jgi:hypothetical protein